MSGEAEYCMVIMHPTEYVAFTSWATVQVTCGHQMFLLFRTNPEA